jgi:hypothetical protein
MPPLRSLAVAGDAIAGGAIFGEWLLTTEGAENTEVSQRKFRRGKCG